MAAAQTGTGKTAAFMLPGLDRLKRFPLPHDAPHAGNNQRQKAV
ncbi:hypothetical protein [Neisseria sp. oral taxon 014]|nr:hypothetical protein [Neisseria sp. oral taxon 014]